MKKVITAFFMSWGMFCAIPCPYPHWDNTQRPLMVALLPFIGLLTGAVWLLVYRLTVLLNLVNMFGAVLMAAIPWLLTGFIHLDGFMDCCDAIMSRRDLPERQRILKDSHTGAFAVICFVLLCLASTSLFSDWDGSRSIALLFIPVAARCCSAAAVGRLKPMGHSSYGENYRAGLKPVHTVIPAVALVVSCVLCAIFGGGYAPIAAAAGSALAIWNGNRQLGGMSGDVSGYGITIGEVCGVALMTLL